MALIQISYIHIIIYPDKCIGVIWSYCISVNDRSYSTSFHMFSSSQFHTSNQPGPLIVCSQTSRRRGTSLVIGFIDRPRVFSGKKWRFDGKKPWEILEMGESSKHIETKWWMLQAVDDTRGCFPPTNGRLLPSRHPKAAAARGKRRAGLHDVFPELCHPYSPMVKAENGLTLQTWSNM